MRIGNPDWYGVNARNVPAIQQAALEARIFRHREFPEVAQHEAVARIELRERMVEWKSKWI